jgi:hypothetical protein
MTDKEAQSLGWRSKPVIFELDDGNLIYPSVDSEGNDAGVLFTNNKINNTLPTLLTFID